MQGVNLRGQQGAGGGVSWGVCKQVVTAGEMDHDMISRSKEGCTPLIPGISTCALWQLLLRGDERKRVAGASRQVVALVEREVACSR